MISSRPEVTRSAQEVLDNLPSVMGFVRHHMRYGRAKGLSVPQFRVLVRAERKATLSEVALWLGTSLPTTSRVVSGLVTKGYVYRVECPIDRRVRKLSLTSRGQRVLRDAYAAARQAMEQELKQLSDAQCTGIAEAMRLMGRVFSEERSV